MAKRRSDAPEGETLPPVDGDAFDAGGDDQFRGEPVFAEDTQEVREESAEVASRAKGADAAMAATQPQESQIRGSFMPGGGAGEDAHTALDPDTHAQFNASASDEEKQAQIDLSRKQAQERYEADKANPDIDLVEIPVGVDATNPNPTVVKE
jgi:hypothetical protein